MLLFIILFMQKSSVIDGVMQQRHQICSRQNNNTAVYSVCLCCRSITGTICQSGFPSSSSITKPQTFVIFSTVNSLWPTTPTLCLYSINGPRWIPLDVDTLHNEAARKRVGGCCLYKQILSVFGVDKTSLRPEAWHRDNCYCTLLLCPSKTPFNPQCHMDWGLLAHFTWQSP